MAEKLLALDHGTGKTIQRCYKRPASFGNRSFSNCSLELLFHFYFDVFSSSICIHHC